VLCSDACTASIERWVVRVMLQVREEAAGRLWTLSGRMMVMQPLFACSTDRGGHVVEPEVFLLGVKDDAMVALDLASLIGETPGLQALCGPDIPDDLRGRDWYLQDRLARASCVVVLWSRASVESEWVRGKADEARARGILVPVVVDDVVPARELEAADALDLSGWGGVYDDPRAARFVAAVRKMTDGTAGDVQEAAASSESVVKSSSDSATESSTGSDAVSSPAPEAAATPEDEGSHIPATPEPKVRRKRKGKLTARIGPSLGTQPHLVRTGARRPPRLWSRLARFWRRRWVQIAAVVGAAAALGLLGFFVFWPAVAFGPPHGELDEAAAFVRLKLFKVDVYFDAYSDQDGAAAGDIEGMLRQRRLVRDVVLVPCAPGFLEQAGSPLGYEIRYHQRTEGDVGWALWKALNAYSPSWRLERRPCGDLRTRGTLSVFLFTKAIQGNSAASAD
jgi:hypothetical protein